MFADFLRGSRIYGNFDFGDWLDGFCGGFVETGIDGNGRFGCKPDE